MSTAILIFAATLAAWLAIGGIVAFFVYRRGMRDMREFDRWFDL